MSVTNLNIAVQITGADEAANKLRNVEDAADKVGSKADKAGGLFAGFERQVKRLDDAVDKVEKPMRTFSGALDIASLALGAGLAGPIGQVITQLGELGKSVLDAAANMDGGAERARNYAATLKKVGEEAKISTALVNAYETAIKGAQGGALTAGQQVFTTEQARLREANITKLNEAQQQLNASLALEAERRTKLAEAQKLELEAGGAINVRVSEQAQTRQSELSAQQRETLRLSEQVVALKKVEDQYKLTETELLRVAKERQDAEAKKAVAIEETKKANERATVSTKARTAAVKEVTDAYAREISIIVEAEKEAQAAAEARAAYDALSPLQFIESLPPPTQSLQQALGDLIAPDAVAPEQVTAAESSLRGLTESAMDLESMGVGALQSFSQAAGQALATLVIDGDKAGVSFSKLAGQVAAGLSAQAFGYAVFLGALGVAAALTGPVLGYTAPGLFQAAGVMAGTGLLLAGTARALGASTVGGSSSAASSGASGGGAQDRVSSFSAGGGGAAPVNVTVVLGVDEVSNVLVRQSQRESRAGSLSSSRLAVV